MNKYIHLAIVVGRRWKTGEVWVHPGPDPLEHP